MSLFNKELLCLQISEFISKNELILEVRTASNLLKKVDYIYNYVYANKCDVSCLEDNELLQLKEKVEIEIEKAKSQGRVEFYEIYDGNSIICYVPINKGDVVKLIMMRIIDNQIKDGFDVGDLRATYTIVRLPKSDLSEMCAELITEYDEKKIDKLL